MAQQWYQYQITQGFKWSWTNQAGHSGIDLGMPVSTIITCPVSGIVVGNSYHAWGGQVDVKFTSGGKTLVVSFLHLSQIATDLKINGPVSVGTILGYSGGVNRGAHPTAPQYSTGPHLHFELTYGAIPPYTTYNPQRSSNAHHPLDPATMLANIRRNGLPAAGASALTSNGQELAYQTAATNADGSSSGSATPSEAAHQLLVQVPGFLGICEALDAAEQLQPYNPSDPNAPQGLTGAVAYPFYWSLRNVAAISFRLLIVGVGVLLVVGVLVAFLLSNRWTVEAAHTAASVALL